MGEVELYGETRKMMKRWLPQRYVTFKLNDMRTSGLPDMVVVANRIFSGWEFKYWDEDGFDWEGIQHLTACRLDREAYCRYAVFMKKDKTIRLVKPIDMQAFVHNGGCAGYEDLLSPGGMGEFDHYAFVANLRKVHNL
jgi:hypothetical protein